MSNTRTVQISEKYLWGYNTIIDLDECPSQIIIDSIKSLEGVRFVRLFS